MSIAGDVLDMFSNGDTPMQKAERTGAEIVALLRELVEKDSGEAMRVERVSRPFTIRTDATGAGQVELGFPPGVAWNLLKIAGNGNTTGYIALYLDAVDDPTRLIEVIATSTIYSEALSPEGDYVPAQSTLIVAVRGQDPDTDVSGRLTAKAYVPSPQVRQPADPRERTPEEGETDG